MSIDPRIDPKMPNRAIVQRIADILRDYGPIQHNGIAAHLPHTTGLTTSYISYVLKKLRAFGMAQCVKKGHPKFVWEFLPVSDSAKQAAPVAKKDQPPAKKVMLKHRGSYRIKAKDGRQFSRMEFSRVNMTWADKHTVLGIEDISHLAYIPDHAAYKSGSKHLDLYAHPFSEIGDCLIPKMKASDADLPAWVHPIRARMLNATVSLPRPERPVEPLKKDFGDPFL